MLGSSELQIHKPYRDLVVMVSKHWNPSVLEVRPAEKPRFYASPGMHSLLHKQIRAWYPPQNHQKKEALYTWVLTPSQS